MRERRGSALWFLLAFVFALGAAFIAHSAYQRYTAGTPVAVAVKFVGPMQPVPADAVRLLSRPTEGLPGDAVRNTAQVIGRYTLYGLVPGEIVQRGALLSKKLPGTALDAQLQELAKQKAGENYRAYVLPLDDKNGYLLAQPDDRVDVIAQVKSQQGSEAGMLLQQVLVLAKIDKSGKENGTPIPGRPQQPQASTSGDLVLALRPSQIAQLALAMETGKVSVALAAPGSSPDQHPALVENVFETKQATGSGTAQSGSGPAGTPQPPTFTGRIVKP